MSGLLGGVLPAIYSQADRAKRYLGGLLSDPVGRMQQAGGQAVDDLTKIGLLGEQAFSDPKNPMKMQDNAASRQLVDTYLNSVMNFAPVGMNVWHGSPHKFDKFDSSKIGTGEGAQAYGHGLYLAENPSVAREYQEKLSSVGGAKNLAAQYGDIDKGIAEAQRRIASYKELIANGGGGAMERAQRMLNLSEKNLQDLSAMKAGLPENTGALYKVDLPDEQIAKMLDWDKPLSQQSPEVKSFVNMVRTSPEKAGFSAVPRSDGLVDIVAPTGEVLGRESAEMAQEAMRIYADGFISNLKTGADLVKRFASPGTMNKQTIMQNPMQAAGIPGVRYLDGGSRGAGGGTSNFVVFPGNESLLTILERNGHPIR